MTERVTIGASLACTIVALLWVIDNSFSKFALPVILFAMGIVFYNALLIAGLNHEVAEALGKRPSLDGEGPYSSISEIRRQLQWSPRFYKVAALVAVAGIVYTAISFGAVSWSTNDPFTSRHAIGSSLYLCCVLIIELPIIASASRMPGTFKENLSLLGKDDT